MTAAGMAVACLAAVPAAHAQDGTAGGATGAPVQDDRFGTSDQRESRASSSAFARLADRARDEGRVEVIVGLRTRFTPEGALTADEARGQRAAIDAQRAKVLDAVRGTRFDVLRTYEFSPYVALTMSPGALQALERSGRAASVHENTHDQALLASTTAIVEATESAAVDRTGAGKVIAVIDTGVDKAHSFLAGKVVSEACYSSTGHCPGGVTSSTASGSGVPCTFNASRCQHGTHVAGIAAGSGASFSGVARAAKLISINAASRAASGNEAFTEADQIKALERVYALRSTFSIAAVNMSIGSVDTFSSHCDANPRKPAIDNLRSVGIATVIASGNSGSNTGVSRPSCISSAITVGNTTDADVVNSSSNSSQQVELLAPGTDVNSSNPGGVFGLKTGTSMAAPHVAGAWAVMKGVSPGADVPTVLAKLQETGRPVTDADNGVVKPRLRLLSGTTRLADTGFRKSADHALTGGDVASNGLGLATRAGAPSSGSIVISGIPSGAKVSAAYLYWMTIGGPDATAVFKGVTRTGTLVGAAHDPCWNRNQLGPVRTYRASIPVSATPGNGSYTISGVGGVNGADGEGASLVLVYGVGTSIRQGVIRIRDGALTAGGGGGFSATMSHTFPGLSVPKAPTAVRLHNGVADGQFLTETPMQFGGTNVTAANFFSGKDKPLWDDDRLVVPLSTLPAGTTSRAASVTGTKDCLSWAYSALAYQY